MDLAVIIVCIHEGDFLRQTLSRSRRALPDAKFCVVYVNEDVETKAVCEALRVFTTISMPAETLLSNNATYNVSAFVRTAQLRMKEMLKKPMWTILTRPQVILDSNLAAMDYSQLDTKNVYGSFFDPILNHTDLLRFQAKEPTAAEVREFVPVREFLLTYGAKDYPSWSKTAAEGTEEFLGQFTFQYMLQLKLGHLGELNEDKEVRTSKRWEERHRLQHAPPIRVAPVHAGAAQQKEEEKKETQKINIEDKSIQKINIEEKQSDDKSIQKINIEEKKSDDKSVIEKKSDDKSDTKTFDKKSKLARMFQSPESKLSADSLLMSTARKEVDQQNIVQPKEADEEKVLSKSSPKVSDKKKNPFQVVLDKV